MSDRVIGVVAVGDDSRRAVATIEDLERRGIPAAWLTTSRAGIDGLTILAAAASRTERIRLGTSITPILPRHPVVTVQQAQVVAQLAPGRFRLGLGLSHRTTMDQVFGLEYDAPLSHLREYLTVVKTLLNEGKVDFKGRHYRANVVLESGVEKGEAPWRGVPVIAAALRKAAFELCGEVADGAISWVCPGPYLRDVAHPAMARGAERAGRPVPPLVAHVPICVHENAQEVKAALREQLGVYPRLPAYARMFADAGYPEAAEGAWSDAMIEAVALSGEEGRVAERLRQLFDWGPTEVIVSVLAAGPDRDASRARTLRFLAEMAKSV